jgi:hypothetical protein
MTTVPPRGGNRGPNRPRPQKASARRQQQKRRNQIIGGGAVAIVVAVVVVAVLLITQSSSNGGSDLRNPATAAEAQKITSVPMSALVAAEPAAQRLIITCAVQDSGCGDQAVTATTAGKYPATLAQNGKPTLLYIGAEFCPICATERWEMIVALSHFGTFTGLKTTHSAVNDGNIPTWSFYGATYTSQYLNFQTYEVEDNQRNNLETPPANISAIWSAFFGGQEAFPFIDFNQKYVFSTEQIVDTALQGPSFSQILGTVGNNNDPLGLQLDAAAAVFTRYLCGMTGNQPSDVCSAVSSLPNTVIANPNGPTSNTGGTTQTVPSTTAG